jgi:F0F1-type ATP synthase assembly protein I
MAFAYLGGHFQKSLTVQAVLALLTALAVGLIVDWRAGFSGFIGGLIVVGANLIYAWVARPRKSASGVGVPLGTHVIAEIAKLGALFVLLAMAFSSVAMVSHWVLVGVVLAVAGHWLSMLLK